MILTLVVALLLIFFLIVAGVLITRVILRCLIKTCDSPVSMSGKVIIVTGANSGVGFETAKNLAARGARVILACRNEDRGIAARDKIIRETGNSNVVLKQLDLSSFKNVRKFAEDIIAKEEYLHVLINNAGSYGLEDEFTEDGILEPMQVNYFAPFLLTLLLLPLLKKSQPSRIINLSSLFQYIAWLNLDHINTPGWYCSCISYANAKLCGIIFTVELAKRLENSGVVANSVHPGVMNTNLTQHMAYLTKKFFWLLCWVCSRSAEEGAQTVIYLSVAEECAQESGNFYVDCQKWYISWKAFKPGRASRLWDISENLVKYKIDDITLNLK